MLRWAKRPSDNQLAGAILRNHTASSAAKVKPKFPKGKTMKLDVEKPTIQSCQHDAVFLEAMIQGVEVIYDSISTDLSPASNAMPAMFESLIARAQKLAADLDRVTA
jgi:hypothetical protein